MAVDRAIGERELGDLWADTRRSQGAWVQKLPASSTAGVPDWLVACPNEGLYVAEAKRVQGGRYAFRRNQLTKAQQMFLGAVAVRRPKAARVVIVAPEGFLEIVFSNVPKQITQEAFGHRAEKYVGR